MPQDLDITTSYICYEIHEQNKEYFERYIINKESIFNYTKYEFQKIKVKSLGSEEIAQWLGPHAALSGDPS